MEKPLSPSASSAPRESGHDDSGKEKRDRLKRLDEAATLHAIEGNPLTVGELEMFAMFEREDWTHEQRRAYILALPDIAKDGPQAAE